MLGADLNVTCVAVGSPMPFVKWRQMGGPELTPEDQLPIGRNVLVLEDIRQSANYTCVAASALGVIEANTLVKVQCKFYGIVQTIPLGVSTVPFSKSGDIIRPYIQ
jgi:receptor-type tyrosine-protein phosphatase F